MTKGKKMKYLSIVLLLSLAGCANGQLIRFERNRPMTNAEYEEMTRKNFATAQEVEDRDPEMAKKINAAIDDEKKVRGKIYQVDLKNMEVKEILFEAEVE